MRKTGLSSCKSQQLPGEGSRGKVKGMTLAVNVVKPMHGKITGISEK